MAALILTAGVFGDVRGRKKVLVTGLVFAAAGATVSLTAHSIGILLLGQALYGVGAAALLPSTLAIISHLVPDHRQRGKFITFWAMSMMAALAVGPIMAGLIEKYASWRWIFLPSIPLGILAIIVSLIYVQDSTSPHTRKLDWGGQITAAVAIVAVIYAVIEGGSTSFSAHRVIASFVVGGLSVIAFIVIELRSSSPMLDLKVFTYPAFTATSLVAMIAFLGLIGFFFVLSLYLGLVQQLDTLHAGARLVIIPLSAVAISPIVGRLMHVIPARLTIGGGLLIIAASQFFLLNLDAKTSFAAISWRLVLLGIGLALVTTPMTASAVSAVPHHMVGVAAAGNNVSRQLGSALGPAILGVILTNGALRDLPTQLSHAHVPAALHPSILQTAHASGLSAVAHMQLGMHTGPVLGAIGDSFLSGLHLCFIVSGILVLAAALVAVLMLRSPSAHTEKH